MTTPLDAHALDVLFRAARSQNGWLDKPVPESLLREVYDLAKMGPTSANSCPMRLVFVTTPAGKERLKPALSPGNLEKTMAAPATAIVARDLAFFEHLPRLFPVRDVRPMFAANAELADETSKVNATLQGAYVILAARALGLDSGAMAGFDKSKVDAEFFPGGRVKTLFLLNLGYGDPAKVHPRAPRLAFDEACSIA